MQDRIRPADVEVDATAQAAADARNEPEVDATIASYAEYQDRMANWKTSVDGLMSGLSTASHFEAAKLTGRGGLSRDVESDLTASDKSRKPNSRGRRRASSGKRGGRRRRSDLNRLQRYHRNDSDQDQDEFAGVLIGFGRRLRVTTRRKYRYLMALLNKNAAAASKRSHLETNGRTSNCQAE